MNQLFNCSSFKADIKNADSEKTHGWKFASKLRKLKEGRRNTGC